MRRMFLAQKKVFVNISNENRQVIDEFLSIRQIQKKSKETVDTDEFCLCKFAHFLNKKHFKDVTEKDLQDFFKTIDTYSTFNLLGIKLIQFYRWLLKLKRKQRPDIFQWFEFISNDKKAKDSNPDSIKDQFITTSEYNTILTSCWDKYGMWEAMFETYYLSGGRLSEVRNMTIGDVKTDSGKVSLVLRVSKTRPREVPLSSYPERLIRWLQNHPNKNNPASPLWISLGTRNYGGIITENGVAGAFYKIIKNTDIKKTLSIHCFRKTRATIMFNERTKDGGLKYSDTHLAMFFGWKPKTVVERRQEYDLTTKEDLNALVFDGKNDTPIETFDILKQQKKRLENEYQKKIESMEIQMKAMQDILMQITGQQINDLVAKKQALKSEQTITKVLTKKDGTTMRVIQPA